MIQLIKNIVQIRRGVGDKYRKVKIERAFTVLSRFRDWNNTIFFSWNKLILVHIVFALTCLSQNSHKKTKIATDPIRNVHRVLRLLLLKIFIFVSCPVHKLGFKYLFQILSVYWFSKAGQSFKSWWKMCWWYISKIGSSNFLKSWETFSIRNLCFPLGKNELWENLALQNFKHLC